MKNKFANFAFVVLFCAAPLLAQQRGAPSTRGTTGARGAQSGPKTSGDYSSDVVVVRDAQESALEQAQELPNARDQATLEAITKEMERALAMLEEAKKSPDKLSEALAAEQAAYQALLKLSAREYQEIGRAHV